jgi:hypothetical protein
LSSGLLSLFYLLQQPNKTASVFKQRFNVCCGNDVPVLSIAAAPIKHLQKKKLIDQTYANSIQRFFAQNYWDQFRLLVKLLF